jgi:putative endonuclease
MYYYTYVLKSIVDQELYIGWTCDLRRRLQRHNNGDVEATRNRIPFQLIYYEACLNKQDAINREKALKTGYGRRYIKTRLSVVNLSS